jgi:hypothetical protein
LGRKNTGEPYIRNVNGRLKDGKESEGLRRARDLARRTQRKFRGHCEKRGNRGDAEFVEKDNGLNGRMSALNAVSFDSAPLNRGLNRISKRGGSETRPYGICLVLQGRARHAVSLATISE